MEKGVLLVGGAVLHFGVYNPGELVQQVRKAGAYFYKLFFSLGVAY